MASPAQLSRDDLLGRVSSLSCLTRTHQTNQQPGLAGRCARMLRSFCSAFSAPLVLAVETNHFRRLLRTVEALSELGPELTAEREFPDTARRMLRAVMEAAGAR